jgi:hypothetical protein
MIRNLLVRVLYTVGETCFLVADQLSPATDEVWRDRRWKQYLRQQARLDSYATSHHCDPNQCGWPGLYRG